MTVDFEKAGGLVPAVVQDADTGVVLMLGYMNREALDRTREIGHVTFFSRSKQRLWTKGETSGNVLELVDIRADCDADALLVSARPTGPVCHTGSDTCWGEKNRPRTGSFIERLDRVIAERASASAESSYTRRLLESGTAKIAQKVGEEAVESVVASLAESDDRLVDEASDLVYHLLVLLRSRGLSLTDVTRRLEERHGGQ